MKTRQKIFLFFIIILSTNFVKAQNLILGGSANIGFSKVTSNLPISGDYRIVFAISGNLGMFMEKKITEKSTLGIEALWVQIEGKEVTKNKELTGFNGQELEVIGMISDKSKLHSSYVGVPIYYRFETEKIGIKGGFQTMIFLFASSNYEATGEFENKPFNTKSKRKDIEFDKIDFGPKIGIDYQLKNNLRLRADYYYGLIDITSDKFPFERRNRQVSIGINYIFGVKE